MNSEVAYYVPYVKQLTSMSSKLEPTIWSCDTGHIGIHAGLDICTCNRTVI